MGPVRHAGSGRDQRRQVRSDQLSGHFRAVQQQHGRRRRQQPGVLLGSSRPHAGGVLDQRVGDQGVPGRRQQHVRRVWPRRRRHGERGDQVGQQRLQRRSVLFPARQEIPVAGSLHHRRDLGHAAGAPPAVRDGHRRSDQEEQGVLLRRLRSAAAQISAGHQHGERNVL